MTNAATRLLPKLPVQQGQETTAATAERRRRGLLQSSLRTVRRGRPTVERGRSELRETGQELLQLWLDLQQGKPARIKIPIGVRAQPDAAR